MKTKEEILRTAKVEERISYPEYEQRYYQWDEVLRVMQEYSDQQTAQLKEQLADLQYQLTLSEKKVELNYTFAKAFEEQLAAKEKELSSIKNLLNDNILACDLNIAEFTASQMKTSELCSGAMKQAYQNVLNSINTPK